MYNGLKMVESARAGVDAELFIEEKTRSRVRTGIPEPW